MHFLRYNYQTRTSLLNLCYKRHNIEKGCLIAACEVSQPGWKCFLCSPRDNQDDARASSLLTSTALEREPLAPFSQVLAVVLNSPSSSCLYCSGTLLWFKVLLASSFTTGLRLLAQPRSPAAAREGALRGRAEGTEWHSSSSGLPSWRSLLPHHPVALLCSPLPSSLSPLPSSVLLDLSTRQKNKEEATNLKWGVWDGEPGVLLPSHTFSFSLFPSPKQSKALTRLPPSLPILVYQLGGSPPLPSWVPPLGWQPVSFFLLWGGGVVLARAYLHQNLPTTPRIVIQKQFFTDPLSFTQSKTPYWHFHGILKWDFNCFPSVHDQC